MAWFRASKSDLESNVKRLRDDVAALDDISDDERDELLREIDETDASVASLTDPLRGSSRGYRIFVLATAVVYTLVLAAVVPPAFIPLIVLLNALWVTPALGRFPALLGAAGYWFIFFLVVLLLAYYYPRPLSRVTVTTKFGTTVAGGLLVQTGDSFYITRAPRRYTILLKADLLSARVVSSSRRRYVPRTYRIILRNLGF
jgi:hypothetical protein